MKMIDNPIVYEIEEIKWKEYSSKNTSPISKEKISQLMGYSVDVVFAVSRVIEQNFSGGIGDVIPELIMRSEDNGYLLREARVIGSEDLVHSMRRSWRFLAKSADWVRIT